MKKVAPSCMPSLTQQLSARRLSALPQSELLLGNVGRAGGGVNALRGHSKNSVPRIWARVFDTLPGYLKCRPNRCRSRRLAETQSRPTAPSRSWDSSIYSKPPKFAVSYLKALFGDRADQRE